MLSKSGGAGVQITAYTQTLADIEASLDGDRAAAARLVGNFNSLIMLRVRTLDTARTLVEQVPNFDITDLAESSSVADSSQAESAVSFTSSLSARVAVRSVHGIEASQSRDRESGRQYNVCGPGGVSWQAIRLHRGQFRSKPHRICIHVDEFNDIVGPHLHPMLSKSGGAGVQITAYTQTLADIEASCLSDGDRAAAARLVGNFNSLIMLRVRTLDTARTLVEQVPNFDITDLAESSSVADSSQAESAVSFTSSLSARVAVRSVHGIEASDLMRLPTRRKSWLFQTFLPIRRSHCSTAAASGNCGFP